MATREKKTPLNNKKQNLASKDMPCDTNQENDKKTQKTTTTKVPIVKKLAGRKPQNKIVKKPGIGIKLKAKAKQAVPLNKKLTKTILKNAKTVEAKKKLLNNGVTEIKKKRGRKKKVDADPQPVEPKKRLTKKVLKAAELDLKKVKMEFDDTSNASDLTDVSNFDSPRSGSRGRGRKIKVEPECVDEVMNELFMLKSEPDCASESGKSDTLKPKRLTKKKKLELAQKEIKKENLNSSQQKVIDSLDLNVRVRKPKLKSFIQKRRHSIEKFPTGTLENLDHVSIFSQLPRSISPRAKRNTKIRQSVDSLRRNSPYTTRSDSPARMLRNGKQRKLKDLHLLEGLDPETRKRRRLCSDLSGSEMSVSKLSGYESDSSFSDLASLHGAETGDSKDADSLKPSVSEPGDVKSFIPSTIIKRSLSTDTARTGPINNLTDTNSNIYNDPNSLDINLNDKKIKLECPVKSEEELINSIAVTPSVKVPDKSFLLDIMKQTFNSDVEKEKKIPDILKTEPIITSKFYGTSTNDTEVADKNEAPVALDSDNLKEINSESEIIADKVTDEEVGMDQAAAEEVGMDQTAAGEEINERISITEEDNQEKAITQDIFEEPDVTEEQGIEEKTVIEDINTETPANDISAEIASEDNLPTDQISIIPACIEETDVPKETNDKSVQVEDLDEDIDETAVSTKKSVSENDIEYNDEEMRKITAELTEIINGQPLLTEAQKKPETAEIEPNENLAPIEEEHCTTETPDVEKMPMEVEEISEKEDEEKSEKEDEEKSEKEDQEKSEKGDEEKFEKEDDGKSEKEEENTEVEPYDAPPVLEPVNNIDGNKIEVHEEESEIEEHEADKTEDTMPVLESSVIEKIAADKPDDGEEYNDIDKPLSRVEEYNDIVKPSSGVEEYNDINKPASGVEESAEEMVLKENILQALGLQSLQAAEEAKLHHKEKVVQKSDNYTGTLKTVIKLNRDKKKGRNSLKMTLQKNKTKIGDPEAPDDGYKIMKESASSSWKHGTNSSDTAGAHRHKSHYSNRSNPDGSSEHTSDGETNIPEGTAKALVIPEKASSFSIHPGRLCKDECSYCFGKFGLFDTPCHIAQMKNVDRQDKILATEKHLTRDSCLCDACYRHVDRKSNTPSYTNKSLKRNSLVAPGPRQNHCHVLGCDRVSTNILRRKWIIKMRKSICQVINIDLDNPGLHSIPICDEHYSALEHLMVCAMCKRRLARNHIHYLGPETADLNNSLNKEGIPLALPDKPVVCKLCKCFAAVILKDPGERPDNSMNFFKEYKKRLLHFNDIVPMDESAAEEPIMFPSKAEKEVQKKKKRKSEPSEEASAEQQEPSLSDQTRVPSTSPTRPESPADYNSVDYNTLIPAIAMDCDSDSDTKKEQVVSKEVIIKKIPRLESVKEAVEISKNLKLRSVKNSDVAVSKLGSNPSISVRQLFPGEEELPLNANIDFGNVKEKTPEGWEKCSSVVQYDAETKNLWNELQKPYGNQSSFLRHLILLEKYFRNGELILSSNASHHAMNYSESVQNRLRAYDNIPSNTPRVQPFTMMQFNKSQKSHSGIITSKKEPPLPPATITNCTPKNTPITSQLNSPPLIPPNNVLMQATAKPKNTGAPPGLISLHSSNIRPPAPPVKVQQSQKIKFPITKNWRPNLIPIDPTKKQERKQGLVQVISGGKPYHITFEDYKKMCAIKRSFEMREKNKRLQEAQAQKPIMVTHNSVLKSIVPRRGLIISKTAAVVKTEPSTSETGEPETILEKLDKHVENIGSRVVEKTSLLMPKIPKSLTVIPQTVAKKPSRPSSPVLIITPKNNSNKS